MFLQKPSSRFMAKIRLQNMPLPHYFKDLILINAEGKISLGLIITAPKVTSCDPFPFFGTIIPDLSPLWRFGT
jgi:hypothetical protein